MALLDRLRRATRRRRGKRASTSSRERPYRRDPSRETAYQELKSRVHNAPVRATRPVADRQVSAKSTCARTSRSRRAGSSTSRALLLNLEERERLVSEIQDEVFGLGPLEPLLAGPDRHRRPGERPRADLRGAPRPARAHRRRASRTTRT